MSLDIVSVGECMVELKRAADGRFDLAYGGDSFNTAVYAVRAGATAAYATALGDDAHSRAIVALAEAEGVATGGMLRVAGRVPGLYMIETDARGERQFLYWRDTAAARDLFLLDDGRVRAMMRGARLVYFTGISLWLYTAGHGLERFLAALDDARAAGARIAFDGNYRTRLWGVDPDTARDSFAEALKRTDIALPTFDDEIALWGDATPQATVERLESLGVQEIAVKLGDAGALIAGPGRPQSVAPPARLDAVDTTAAGDSFNAGYLAARLRGVAPRDAAQCGHRLAAAVIAHPGAIVPATATADAVAAR